MPNGSVTLSVLLIGRPAHMGGVNSIQTQLSSIGRVDSIRSKQYNAMSLVCHIQGRVVLKYTQQV